MFITLRYVF